MISQTMNIKWERIHFNSDNDEGVVKINITSRARVFGGWLVKHIIVVSYKEARENLSMVFVPDPNHEWGNQDREELLDKNIDTLYLSIRLSNCLHSEKIYTIRDLVNYEKNLLHVTNFSVKSAMSLNEALNKVGIELPHQDNRFFPKINDIVFAIADT